MTILQAKEMIRSRIEYKENQIKTRKIQLDSGKFEIIMDIIEVEIKSLQKDIEFFKMIEKELDS